MEELYKKYHLNVKVNNIFDNSLIFKFNSHHINRMDIVLAIISIILIVFLQKYYFSFYLIFFIILIIYNKLSIATVYFDDNCIIIKKLFKKQRICYKNGIKICINRGINANFRDITLRNITSLLIRDETRNQYSLIIQEGRNLSVIATVVNNDMTDSIKQFIDNFYFDENVQNEKDGIRFQI